MFDLSVIIVNYNGEPFLPDCLTAIYHNTHRLNLEVLFVDNKSSDHSLLFVRNNFPQVRIMENEANLGFGCANNRGLAVAQGRYFLLLNTDTIVRDGALDKMVAYLEDHPQVGVLGPKLINPDGTPQHQGGLLAKKFWLLTQPVPVDYVLGAALMVRREVWERVGGLDENFFFSNDDLDWCRRIRQAGWAVHFLPTAEIVHHGGFTIKRFHPRLLIEGFRGGLYFCRKHYGNFAYQIYRILLVLSLSVIIIFSCLLYPFLKNQEKLAAYWQILLIAWKGELIGPKNPLNQ